MAPLSNEDDTASGDDEVMKEEEEEEPETQTRGKRKNKKMKMGEESGLTDAERRKLRRKQRELNKLLAEGPAEEDEDFVVKARKKNNELFEKVRYTREAVLDAENVDSIAAKFVKKADGMIVAHRYDATKFTTKLKSKLTVHDSSGGSYFDWQTLGQEAGVCFNSLPSRVTFLSGPLANVKVPEKRKVRAQRQKKMDVEEEELEEESPEQMKKQKKNVDQLSQAERNLKKMSAVLAQRTLETFEENRAKYNEVKESQSEEARSGAKRELQERGGEVDFVPFLVNPQSFTQTVENIFNFSFLVKKGEAKIKMRKAEPLGDSEGDSGGALGLAKGGCFVSQGDGELESSTKQCVLSFTMKDWRALCEAYDLEKCDIPHRKGTKQKATKFSQQQMSSQEELEEEEVDE